MKRIIGFAAFFVAVGMLIAMFLPNTFAETVAILVCLLLGYNLYCC